jgi:hypothetical protein
MDTVSVVSTVRELHIPDTGDFKEVPVIEVSAAQQLMCEDEKNA